MILNGWAVIIYWKIQGISFLTALSILTIYWSLTLIITYYGTDLATYLLKKMEPFEVLIETFKEVIKVYNSNPIYKKRGEIINWLSREKAQIVFSLTFIPVPQLPTITIIAARIMKLKYGLPVLLIGNVFRITIMCLIVYFFPSITCPF